jgi:hypothetical protein
MSQPEDRPSILVRLLEFVVVIGAFLQRRQPLPRGVDAEDLATGYEHSDMHVGVILAGAAALLVTLALVLVGVTLLEQTLVGIPPSIGRPADLTQGLQAPPAPTPPAPQLEALPAQTLDAYRAAEQQKLSSYGWVDRSTGSVRIPVDRAIELTAQRGLPSRPAPAAQDDGAHSPSVASSGRVEEPYP